MFEKDAFQKREKAMEDEFFHRVDEKLREELREKMQRDRSREALSEATGLKDTGVLDELIDNGFDPTTLTALSLVPAVFVAWADDKVDQPEQQALLNGAKEYGLKEDGPAWKMIAAWIDKRPDRSLWETWQSYARAVSDSLSLPAAGLLAEEITKLSIAVAQASGGILGLGKISSKEQSVLDEIESTLKKELRDKRN